MAQINNNIPDLDELIKNHKDLEKSKEIIATIDKDYYFMFVDMLIRELERERKLSDITIDELDHRKQGFALIKTEDYCEFVNSNEDCCWKTNKDCTECLKEYLLNQIEKENLEKLYK